MLDSDGDVKVTSARDRCERATAEMAKALGGTSSARWCAASGLVTEVFRELNAGLMNRAEVHQALTEGLLAAWEAGRTGERARVRSRVLDLLGVSDG